MDDDHYNKNDGAVKKEGNKEDQSNNEHQETNEDQPDGAVGGENEKSKDKDLVVSQSPLMG
jgi:hypothetical protein